MGPYVSLFFANHDWRFQMNVKDHEKFVITWLEEQVLDVTEQYILGSVSVGYWTSPRTNELTDLLCSQRRLVSKPILMDLYLPRQALAVRGGSHKDFRKLVGSSAFHLHKDVLLDDVRKFLLLLFALVHFLFQVSYLSADDVEPMAVCGSVCDRTDEGRVRIFKGLALNK